MQLSNSFAQVKGAKPLALHLEGHSLVRKFPVPWIQIYLGKPTEMTSWNCSAKESSHGHHGS